MLFVVLFDKVKIEKWSRCCAGQSTATMQFGNGFRHKVDCEIIAMLKVSSQETSKTTSMDIADNVLLNDLCDRFGVVLMASPGKDLLSSFPWCSSALFDLLSLLRRVRRYLRMKKGKSI